MSQTKKYIWRLRPWMWGLPLILLLGIYLYQKDASPLEALARTPSQIELSKGRELFSKNCASCHGVNAVGQIPDSPKGGISMDGSYLAPALNGTGHAWHHPDSTLYKNIKHGSIASDSSMRAFSGRLSDEEIILVIQYFKSLWPETIRERHALLSKEEA